LAIHQQYYSSYIHHAGAAAPAAETAFLGDAELHVTDIRLTAPLKQPAQATLALTDQLRW
jgi:hypothetical protein